MAFLTFGSHLPFGGVDADSDAVLNMRLDAVLDKMERLHVGSVLSYIGGPNPERAVRFRDAEIDVRITLQVRARAIRVSVPMANGICRDFLDGGRTYLQYYDTFISDGHPADSMDRITVRGDGAPYGTSRFLFTYRSTGTGREEKTMEFATPYAAHLARFLDNLLGTSIELAFSFPDDDEERCMDI